MTAQDAMDRAAQNATFAVIARAAMVATPIVLGILGWFIERAYNDLVDTIDALTTAQSSIANRVTILEAKSDYGRQDRLAFQGQVTDQLKDMQAGIVILSNQVSALNANVDSLKSRQTEPGR